MSQINGDAETHDEMFESIVRIVLSSNNQSSSNHDEDDQEYAFLLGEYVMEAFGNGKTTKSLERSLSLLGEKPEIVQAIIEYMEQKTSSVHETSKTVSTDDEKIAKARSRLNHLLQEKYPELKDQTWGLSLSHTRLGSNICILLDERKEEKMIRAIDRMGKAFIVNVLRETLSIQQIGGLNVASGERRRTPGGVFWTLLESQITTEDKKYITKLERQARNRRRRRNAGKQQYEKRKSMNHSENRKYQHKPTQNKKHYGINQRREHTKSRQQERRYRSQMNRRRERL